MRKNRSHTYMVRITTGKAKNRKLRSPKIPEFRAVQEVAKSAVFSILEDKTANAVCLDLFAGSGNLGIEALSRGATYCDFVDENRKAIKTIEKNLRATGFNHPETAQIHQQEAVKFVADSPREYDIVFADPFYKDVKHKFLMELLQETLAPQGVVIFFHGENLDMEQLIKKTDFRIAESRRYGKSYVDFLILTNT